MSQDLTRPDLTGEVRFKVPLVFAIPLGALALIAVLAIGFSWVLLSVPKDAATAIAMVMAANVLGASAVLALRPRVQRGSLVELLVVALYPVIVGIAIAQTGIVGEAEETAESPATEAPAPTGEGGGVLVASQIQWQTDALTLEANKPNELEIQNEDTTVHNMSIYPDEAAATAKQDALFQGEDVAGGESVTYEIDPLKPGTYTFICDYHANMIGEVTVE
ncbi:MAG: cupredoxin domain-containing protein [Actinomycetota bacterium]|nr:cupredoxin domain-containing protein [Actinomycetota bacterium]